MDVVTVDDYVALLWLRFQYVIEDVLPPRLRTYRSELRLLGLEDDGKDHVDYWDQFSSATAGDSRDFTSVFSSSTTWGSSVGGHHQGRSVLTERQQTPLTEYYTTSESHSTTRITTIKHGRDFPASNLASGTRDRDFTRKSITNEK